MAGRRDIRLVALAIVAALAVTAPSAGAGETELDRGDAVASAKKKCKKKGLKTTKKGKCKKRKRIASTVTITNCPTTPVPSGTPVTITGTLAPDAKGKSPLGAIWESSPAASTDGALSFFTAPGGAWSFTFTPGAPPGLPAAWTVGVRIDFAGDTLFGHTLFADRRPSAAACSFTAVL
jgi:hypothetical protein